MGPEHTGGAFSAVFAEINPGEGPPPRLHRDREEYFYVLEGAYQLSVDSREAAIGPGTLVFVPRGTVHEMEAGSGFDPEKFAEIDRRFATGFAG